MKRGTVYSTKFQLVVDLTTARVGSTTAYSVFDQIRVCVWERGVSVSVCVCEMEWGVQEGLES